MKNKFLSKAYGGVREARSKHYCLGLPRQWKVITSTLLLLFTFAIGNVWAAEIFSTDVLASVSSATVSQDKGAYTTGTATSWSDPYENYFATNGSAGYYQLAFSTPISLTGYTDVKVNVYWGTTSNRPLNMTINGGSATKIDEVTASADRSKLRVAEGAVSVSSISSLKLSSSGGGGVHLFRIEIVGTPSGGGGGDPVDPTLEYNAGAYTIGATALDLSSCIKTKQSTGAITYSVKTDGGTSATITGTSFTAENAGTCVVTASQAEVSGTYNAASADFNVVVSAAPVIEPTGTATISYALSGSTTTGTVTGVNSISGLSSSLTLSTLTLSGTKDGYSGAIKGCTSTTELVEADYVDVQFTVASGYVFTPSAVSVKVNPFTATGAVKAVVALQDAALDIRSEVLSCAKSTDNAVTFASGAFTNKKFEGTVHLRMYFYGPASDKTFYLKSPISITGTVAVAPTKYNVNFDKNDEGAGGSQTTLKYEAGAEVTLPACTFDAPTGKEFDAWTSTDVTITDGKFTMPSNAVTIKATWKALVAKYTVIFKDGDVTLDTKLFDVGSNPSDAEIDKTKALYTFAAWQKDEADIALDDAFWATVAKDAEVSLTARWAKAYASNADFEAYILANTSEKDDADKAEAYVKSLNYALSTKTNTTFDANNSSNNGAYAGLKIKNSGTVLSWNVAAGKVVEFKAGVMVANGSLSINGGAATTIDGGTTGTGDNFKIHYFYSAAEALYEFTTSNGSAEVVKAITMRDPFEVSFDVNGGDAPIAAMYGTPSVTLPSATKGTESFLGWFDALDNKIGDAGASYIPTANITLHAQWEAISTDNTLSDLKVGGVTVDGFDPAVHTYYVVLPYGTAVGDIPVISATANSAKAKQVAIQQAVWTDEPYNCYRAQANVQAEDESWGYYDVRFSFAPKDGVSLIKVATTGGTNKTVTGAYAGDGDVNLSSSKKMDNGKYIGFTLDGTTLQAGDRINVHTSQAANTGGSHIIFYDNMTDKNELYDTEEIGGTGDNIFTINAAMVGSATAYVYRSNADAAHQWNGYVDYIEVTRAMDPVLTAITIDGRDGEIDALDDKHFSVTIPYESDLAALTVVPTVIRNAVHATTPEAVISNEGAWILGANTYRVMDKDGDYTDYTITLTRDVLKHTVSFNTHGGSAVASEEVEHNAYLASAPTAPTKEDYIFKHWSLTDGGEAVDVTTVKIDEDKTFHAVWEAETGVVKLIVAGAINHTNFYTGATMSETPVTIETVEYDYAQLGSTASNPSVNALNKLIAYNATTTKTKVMLDVYNKNTSARTVKIWGVVEGSSEYEELASVALDNGDNKRVKTGYYEFNNLDGKNRTIYIGVPSSVSDVAFLQVKVVESGDPIHMFGEVGYSINFNKGRLFGPSANDLAFEGMTYNLSSGYQALSSTAISLNKNSSYRVDVASPVTMNVTTSNGSKFYVDQATDGTANETASAGEHEFNLTAGTWYINVAGSNLGVSSISFALPKCAEPVIDAQPVTNITFGAGNLTASVTAHPTDGGTLSYQWYNASDDSEVAGATDASFETADEGTYYVIVTNKLAGYQDNSVTSESATLAHRVMNDATLSALSYGDPATAIALEADKYEYRVDLAMGTTDVPALAATATMDGYANVAITDATVFENYEATSTVVVTAEDGLTQKTYTVKFVVDHIYSALVDVTESTTWNWTGDVQAVINDVDNKGLILANYIDGANFEMIEGKYNEYARRTQNEGVYQGTYLHFNTTVAGKVKIYFRAPSSGENCTVTVKNNGKEMVAGTRGNSFGWSKEIVVKGDVVIEMENDKEGGGMTRVQQLVFTELTPDYTRNVTNNIGTLCVDHNVLVGGAMGATFYQIASRNELYDFKIDFEEVLPGEELKAGEPYIFQSTTGRIDLFYGETEADAPVAVRGMYGWFSNTEESTMLDITEANKSDILYIAQNKLWNCEDLVTSDLEVVNNRAYIVMSEVPTYADYQAAQTSNPAPRRRVTLGRNGENTATGIDAINASDKPMKLIIDGNIYILRGEKMYDATGRLVK